MGRSANDILIDSLAKQGVDMDVSSVIPIL